MTAVAPLPSLQPDPRSAWTAASNNSRGLSTMSTDEVSRMFMPRKSVQRSNSSSSIASSAASSTSSTSTTIQQPNGIPTAGTDQGSWATKKRPPKSLWPSSKAESGPGAPAARPQAINGSNVQSSSAMSAMHQPSPVLPSQQMLQSQQQQNGARMNGVQGSGDSNVVLYLLPMNGTFERKTIGLPFYPEVLRIGRQTNAKTLPTPANGYFDSKVLSRQHAEVWADRMGKIWIRDVKSSNGTFVNGQRLSPENRDSEPHELREQDILELGIDIVSEDQRTVVHHKVAARVEHAGFYGNSTNVLDLNFGDIDPTSGGGMMVPSFPQNLIRGRTGSQGSLGSNGRGGPGTMSLAGSNFNGAGQQQRHMNFWLTPVTMEQIVRKLTNELRAAKQQSMELQRTGEFFANIAPEDGANPLETGPAQIEQVGSPLTNGVLFGLDSQTHFSDPPAPPPRQPLPEKPDGARPSSDSPVQPGLKRTETERPQSLLESPSKEDTSRQIITLMEAVASAKQAMDSQTARVKDLEDLLQRERTAREEAEDRARRLEVATHSINQHGSIQDGLDDSPQASEDKLSGPYVDQSNGVIKLVAKGDVVHSNDEEGQDEEDDGTDAAEASALRLQRRLDLMVAEMGEMKQLMESYRRRAEAAEEESASSRQTLAEMVEKIRRDSADDGATPTDARRSKGVLSPRFSTSKDPEASSERALDKSSVKNGRPIKSAEVMALENAVSAALAQSRARQQQIAQSAPYASILGVVVIGVGLMAFLNGWQKGEK